MSVEPSPRSRLHHSGQAKLFGGDAEISAMSISAPHQISNFKTFRVPNISDYLDENQKEKFENKFFRTRTGEAGRKGYSQKITHDQLVMVDIIRKPGDTEAVAFSRSGPRDYTVFHPSNIKAAIVTCGGLCPGLNDVVEELVQMLYYNYSVDKIYGIKSGFRGFYEEQYLPYLELNPQNTKNIHQRGGTILGSSRGGFDKDKIVNVCLEKGINQLYFIGGDGTHRAANIIYQEARARKLKMTVVGIPKTIDNDIGIIDRSFGFDTAVEQATKAIDSARIEAECIPNGVGIVKLMGRSAGFIAAHATLADRNVDICLIPEIPIDMNDVLSQVDNSLRTMGHCVIVVAEGAGESLMSEKLDARTDESGNKKLPPIGEFLKEEIEKHFKSKGVPINVKYNNPSYMIRSVPANAADSVYAMILAQNAVHGAMAGYTGYTSAMVNNRTVMIPMDLIVRSSPTNLQPNGRTWERVIRITHQRDREFIGMSK
jgi:6-phosphofructokinase 1